MANETSKVSYLDWSGIIAGAVLAAALSFVLLTAGAATGLSMVSVRGASHGTAAKYLIGFWALAVPIGALLAGGYLAGRMRAAWNEGPDEVEFRDGVHGALVWGLSILFGAGLAMSAAHTAGRATASLASGAASAVEAAAPSVATMLQSQPDANANRPVLSSDQQSQISAILMRSVRDGSLSDGDKTYLTQTVAQVTGVPVPEAEKRVNDAYQATVQSVESARKGVVTTGLVTATAMLLGLAAAWYAAQRGGHHRDTNRPARFFSQTIGRAPPTSTGGPPGMR